MQHFRMSYLRMGSGRGGTPPRHLHEHGLTLCADGLRRLIIPKNGGNEEMKYKICDHCGAHLDNGETCDCQKDADENKSGEERSANNDRN